MAAIKRRKYSTGSVTVVEVDTDNTTNPHTKWPIIKVEIEQAVYDALHADGKTDIRAVTIGDLIDLAYT